MRLFRIALSKRLALGLTGLFIAAPVAAELYKCRQPDGRVSYQQTVCSGIAEGDALTVETRGPNGGTSDATERDYSVESQLRQMQTAREATELERERARSQTAAEARRSRKVNRDERDPAKCARHRAEVAKWKQKLLRGYRQRSEKEINESKLAYHQTLTDRYCD